MRFSKILNSLIKKGSKNFYATLLTAMLPGVTYAVDLNNPAAGSTLNVTPSTATYTAKIDATSSLNVLNINNTSNGGNYTVTINSPGEMFANASITSRIPLLITNPTQPTYPFNVSVIVNSGGRMTNTGGGNVITDGSTGQFGTAGTTSLTINGTGVVQGRFFGQGYNRLATVTVNTGATMDGDIRNSTGITNSGTLTGTIETGTETWNSGTITNNATGIINGNITMYQSSTINNSGTINGSITVYPTGIVNINGTGTVSGAIAGTGTLNIGETTSSAYVVPVNGYVNMTTIALKNSSSLTISNGAQVAGFSSMTGSRPVTINAGGMLFINAPNALQTTSTVANSGTIYVLDTLNPSLASSFTNPSGTIIVAGSGAITNPISATGTSNFTIGNSTYGSSAFTTQGTIAGFTTFAVTNNSSLTAGHAISGVNTAFSIENGSSATFNTGGAISGTGTFTNNGTLNLNTTLSTVGFATPVNSSNAVININNVTFTTNGSFTNNGTINTNNTNAAISGALVGGAGSILNIGATTANTFVASSTITGIRTINVTQGSFSSAFAITGVDTSFFVTAGQSATMTNTLSGAGTLLNNGTFTLGASSALSGFSSVENSSTGTMLVTGSSANSTSIVNNGTMTVSNTLAGSGTITNNNILTFAANTNNSNTVQNFATFNVSGSSTNSATINNTATMTVSNTLAGSGNIVNTGTLTFAANTNNSNTVTNNNTFLVSGSSTNSAVLTNNSNMTVSSTLAGSGSILNTGTLTFASGTINSNSVTNNNTFNVSGSSSNSAVLTNNGGMFVTSDLTGSGSITNNASSLLQLGTGANTTHIITNNIDGILRTVASVTTSAINNSGTLELGGNISMPGQVLSTTSSGEVNVSGQRSITASSYTNSGDHNTHITSDSVYDSLTVTGNANLSGGTVNVTAGNATGSWTILSTSGTLTPPSVINLPSTGGGLFSGWTSNVTSNSIIVNNGANPFVDFAYGTVNMEIAEVLDQMAAGPTNPGQDILLDAFRNSPNAEVYNANLQLMRPNTNAAGPVLLLQSKIFTRIESRIASLENGTTGTATGFVAGDCAPNTAVWLGGFGSYAKQSQLKENLGYNATAYGALLGVDTRLRNGIFGIGAGVSRTIVNENVNPHFNSTVEGIHLIGYGTKLCNNATFFEWLASGAYTKTSGSRMISVSDVVMSTTSDYHGGQGAARVNYGVDFEFGESLYVSPLTMMQYVLAYLPDYDEAYSPAALHVNQTNYQNVFTVGAGTRFSAPCDDDWWLMGTREIRILGTYDVISSHNNVVSNFLVGSNTFDIVNSAAGRFAFKAGIDLAVKLFSCVNLQFSYDYELRSRYYDHSGAIKLKFLF